MKTTEKMLFFVLAVIICASVFLLGLSAGSEWIPVSDFNGNAIVGMRAARMAAAFVTGSSLALSGLIFQTILRNPLAEPFTLGLSGGAAVGAALAFLTGAYLISMYAVNLFALAGALIVLFLVLLIAKGGSRGAETLLLSGVIMGTIMSGILMYLISIAQNSELAGLTWWMLGDLQCPDRGILRADAVLLIFGTFAARYFAGDMDALSLGEDQARDLGVHAIRTIVLLTLLAAVLAAGTVALAGIVGFCGLVIPHAVRCITGSSLRKRVFPVVFAGGAFLMICDVLSRLGTIREIPVGVITSLIGGPLFLWLLNRKGRC